MMEQRPTIAIALRRGLVVLLIVSIGVVAHLDAITALLGRSQSYDASKADSVVAQVPAAPQQDHEPLSFRYQDRLNRMQWLKGQCELCQSIIHPNQTVFPYLEVPPLAVERAEQFDILLKARIAVLHVWSSDESLAPPFFQYWLASAMANAPIADFFIFVPDSATADLLQRLMPDDAAINIYLHVVGDLVRFYHQRLGSTLDAANFEFSGKTISRLKPMLAYVFEDYIETYSHWAWADMDVILGNLTKFLVRPLAEEYDVISVSAVDYYRTGKSWLSHLCSRFNVALAGQLVVFTNTHTSRNYFREGGLQELKHHYDEIPFAALLQRLGVRIAHVFAQVTDQFRCLDGTQFDWSSQGLFQLGTRDLSCYDYEVALVHVMMGKDRIRPIMQSTSSNNNARSTDRSHNDANCSPMHSLNNASLENSIFPGPFVWEYVNGLTANFPVSESQPWQVYDGPSLVSDECIQ